MSNKSAEFEAFYHSVHPDPTAPAKVPVLQDGEFSLIESLPIAEYLEHKYKSSGTQLLPDNPEEVAVIKVFIDIFSNYVLGPVFKLYSADSQKSIEEAKESLERGLKVVNDFLEKYGSTNGGDYFYGAAFTMADLALIPFVLRIIPSAPAFRNIDLWTIMEKQKLDRLATWVKAGLSRPSVKQSRPSDEDILKSWSKFVKEVKEE